MHALGALLLFHLVISLGQSVHGSKIINGQIVPKNTMLYMVSVQSRNRHICGGSLIREDIVITAAHCEAGRPDSVLLGSQNLKSRDVIRVRIKQKFMHPNYTSAFRGKDIMILKLSAKASSKGKHVQTIPLPKAGTKLRFDQICTVAGWGLTEDNTIVDVLRSVKLSVVSQRVCQWRWNFRLPPNVICASGNGHIKGDCDGDSGGPLICNGVGMGVVSYGAKGCRAPYAPNVYTDVSKYIGWINEILQKN
ncbi:PREDICTED: duodenase-1-like [Cyprinodon variegatus]|uniref:Duodenase-1-like n=1 Tax=Cyprinodon variegatus TaxID=28743 RepID=A0A3Q2FE03_CYPVA|nr:PREDICTED: duodenase-1-like [Cyprinodon variegatus]